MSHATVRHAALPKVPPTGGPAMLPPWPDADPVALLTTVIWVACLLVGALGLLLPYSRPQPHLPPPQPVPTRLASVKLTPVPLASVPSRPAIHVGSVAGTRPSPPPELIRPAGAPPRMAVATPVPATALAGPGSEPVRGVSDAPGGSGAVPVTAMGTPAVPPSRVLTLGEGEGRQPAPGYPRAAVRERQEGTVRVGLDVGPDGRVQAAAVLSSSGWPLLDEAALRTVRLRWQFGPGPLRRYEVPFHFNLRK